MAISAESGTFSATQSFWPAQVDLALLPGVTHHLTVAGRVKRGPPPCCYGGYTLWTTRDRYGSPLVIVHQPLPRRAHLPFVSTRWAADLER